MPSRNLRISFRFTLVDCWMRAAMIFSKPRDGRKGSHQKEANQGHARLYAMDSIYLGIPLPMVRRLLIETEVFSFALWWKQGNFIIMNWFVDATNVGIQVHWRHDGILHKRRKREQRVYSACVPFMSARRTSHQFPFSNMPSTRGTHHLTGHGNSLDVVAAKLDLILHVRSAQVIYAFGKFHPSWRQDARTGSRKQEVRESERKNLK